MALELIGKGKIRIKERIKLSRVVVVGREDIWLWRSEISAAVGGGNGGVLLNRRGRVVFREQRETICGLEVMFVPTSRSISGKYAHIALKHSSESSPQGYFVRFLKFMNSQIFNLSQCLSLISS
jgi:hypothetical protein